MIKLSCDYRGCDVSEERLKTDGVWGDNASFRVGINEELIHSWVAVEKRLFCSKHGNELQDKIIDANIQTTKKLVNEAVDDTPST